MQPLTLQLYHQGVWQDAARLSIQQPELGLAARCNLAYQSDYLVEHLEALQTRLGLAVSANYPLSGMLGTWSMRRLFCWIFCRREQPGVFC